MSEKRGYLKPKAGEPEMIRSMRNGQFRNPPVYMELGGLTGPGKIMDDAAKNMKLERGGPKTQKGKPI